MRVENKVALVTGGTRGIGLGIARKLAEAGFTLAITGRRAADQVQPVLEQLKKHSPHSIYVQADVASTSDRQQLLQTVEAQLGRLDVLVNNAGIAPRVRADVLEASEESFDELIATNLRGPYFLTQSVAAWMIRQRAAGRFDHQHQFCVGHRRQREPRRLLHLQGRHRHGYQAVGGAAGGVRHRCLRGASRHHRNRHDRGG